MSYSLLPPPPRGGSRLLARRRAGRRRVKIVGALVTAGFLFFLVMLFGLVVAFGFFARNLPSPTKLTERNVEQATKIFDRNGTLLYNVFGDQNRTLVTLDKVPKDLRNATVAIEDKNFYKHQGFDYTGILRSFKEILVDHKLAGGSTLTQQVVKNTLLSSERTVTRKIKEFILAVQIERRYSKDEIIQIYLNEVPYGGTAWGVEAAANQYFGKHVSELSLVESAILAGLPQQPSVYSPFSSDPKAYINRTKDVLRRMQEDGYLTKEQEKKVITELPNVKFAQFGQNIKAPHFSLYVKKLLAEKYGEKMVLEGGLQVTTSLDLPTQEMAQRITRDTIAAQRNLRVSNGAVVVEDTKTGQILALVGSKDYFATDIPGNYDVATQALRQPGSALKPLNYVTGFKKGYTPSTMFLDETTDFGNYKPGNWDDKFHGPLSIRLAFGNSYNIPAIKMLAVNGIDNMIKTTEDFGITSLNDPRRYGLSLTIGGGEIHLDELTNAYAIFGNMGKAVSEVFILKVTDSKGNVLEEYKPKETRQVVTPEHAYLINNILADKAAKYMTYGTYWANRLNFQPNLAVKTGTTDKKVDNWSFGYTPGYTVGVWVGNNDNSPMHPSLSSGVTGAAPIYHDVMVELLKSNPLKYDTNEPFARPAGIVEAEVDALSGMKPGPNTSAKKVDIFAKWQVPTQEDDMHVKVRICKPSGLLSTPACEAAGQAEDRVYVAIYDPYTKLFRGDGYKVCSPCPPTAYDDTISGPAVPVVTITEPDNNGNVFGSFEVKAGVTAPSGTSITSVKFYIDNSATPKATDNSSPYKVTLTTGGLTNGTHTLTVKAFADDGTVGEKSININVVPP